MEACRDLVIEIFSKEGLEYVVKDDKIIYHKMVLRFEENSYNDQNYGASIQVSFMKRAYFHPQNDKVEDFASDLVNFLKKEKADRDEEVAKYGLIPKEQADKAARWWAEQLRGKKKSYPGFPLMGVFLFEKLEESLAPADQRISRFETLLSHKIQEEIADNYGVTLSTDYDPNGLLYEAWKESETSEARDDGFGRFPIKTIMRVYKDKVLLVGNTEFINDKCIQKTTPI